MNKDFLHIDDWSTAEILSAIELAIEVKAKVKRKEAYYPFRDHTLAMVFTKPSARTRVSFEVGFHRLGGHAVYLGPSEVDIGKREPVKDIARVLSGYNDLIMARLHDHAHILEMARYASVPVINGLTDYNHPCQIMGDALTIREKRGSLEGLKVAYIGDGNNVLHSWLRLATRLPIHIVCACPEKYMPNAATVEMVRQSSVGTAEIVNDPFAAVHEADVVYTDVWASMGQKHEFAERKPHFAGFTVDSRLMAAAKPEALFMHCLPAQRQLEVTDEVMESKASVVFEQAENRMHMQNAIMLRLTGKG